jgi:hypothetical protein
VDGLAALLRLHTLVEAALPSAPGVRQPVMRFK